MLNIKCNIKLAPVPLGGEGQGEGASYCHQRYQFQLMATFWNVEAARTGARPEGPNCQS